MDKINNSIQKQFSVYVYRKLESVYVWLLLPLMRFSDKEYWILLHYNVAEASGEGQLSGKLHNLFSMRGRKEFPCPRSIVQDPFFHVM
jgi:hypothetical protein